jgi:hypothetical protein
VTDVTEVDRRLSPDDDLAQLPELIEVSTAFAARMPSQRILDLLRKLEPDQTFGDLAENQPPRLLAFRALLRDHPRRDPASLWMHAYDVEIALTEVDPTNGRSPMLSPPSAPTTA